VDHQQHKAWKACGSVVTTMLALVALPVAGGLIGIALAMALNTDDALFGYLEDVDPFVYALAAVTLFCAGTAIAGVSVAVIRGWIRGQGRWTGRR
jgi:hypothetical protein